MTNSVKKEKETLMQKKKRWKVVRKNWVLYFFLIPSLFYFFIFHYYPLYGIQIAFRDFKPVLGIWESNWVGIQWFSKFFNSYQFKSLLLNTFVLSSYKLLVSFIFPIGLALLLNYCISKRLGKVTQMVTYAPHFISAVVLVGMINVFFADNGILNQLMTKLEIPSYSFLSEESAFRHLYVWTSVWQHTGYNSVIYIATLAGVSQDLHEAATMDGAGKLQRMRHIDLPALMPTAIILLIMSTGNMLNIGFERIYLMQNDLNLGVSEIISTYVYKIGLLNAQYSYSTAIGLFNNIINLILLLTVNKIADKVGNISLIGR